MSRSLLIAAILALVPVSSMAQVEIGCTGSQCIGQASLSWSAVTQNTDDTPVTVSGYNVYHATSADGLRTWEQGGMPIAWPSQLSQVVKLPAGTHYFAVTAWYCASASSCVESALSAVVQKTIDAIISIPSAPIPKPPTPVTIAVVPGANMAPVFKLTSTGKRQAEAAGFIPLGELCSGNVLFTYRAQSYRRVEPTNVKLWNITQATSYAAPCG